MLGIKQSTSVESSVLHCFTSVLCGDGCKFSGPELISDGLEEIGNVCCGQIINIKVKIQ